MTPREAVDFRRESRLISALLAADLSFGMLQTAMLILTEESSIVSKIAHLAGHPYSLAVAFLMLAGMLAPYMIMQAVDPTVATRLAIVRLTVHALLAAGVLRIYFAYASRDMDLDTASAVLAFNGTGCILMAALLAYSVNNKQKRDAA